MTEMKLFNQPAPFGGVKIIESLAMVDQVEDWSRVRSPGRARRRRHKYPQNIRFISVPKKEAISLDDGQTLIVHPETARFIRKAISSEMDRAMESAFVMGARSQPAAEPVGVLTAEGLTESLRHLTVPVPRHHGLSQFALSPVFLPIIKLSDVT